MKLLLLGSAGIGPDVIDARLKVLDVGARAIGLASDLNENRLHADPVGSAGHESPRSLIPFHCFMRSREVRRV